MSKPKPSDKLYELTAEVLALAEMLQAERDEEETDEEMVQCISDTMEGVKHTFNEKAINLGYYIRNLETGIDIIKAEAERLKSRRERLERTVNSVKAIFL